MLIKRKRGWEIPEAGATPEAVYFSRRDSLKSIAAGATAALLPAGLWAGPAHAAAAVPDPSLGLYPAKRNPKYTLDRPITDAKDSTTYNNFYEFGTDKDIVDAAQALKPRPWTIKIDGMVEKPLTFDIDSLLKQVTLEERLYRHRCVEAWSMAVPWTGFPLKSLVALAKPLSGATYVRFETFNNPDIAPGQGQFFYPWPYVEGLTMAEATNELAFLATGLYGKPMLPQNGTPIRLVTPWKYGFKSIKSIVKISFVKDRPHTFWESLQSSEYGFWANVNPQVPHPRWSQASERVLGTNERVPTQIWNGYGEYVADIYKNLQNERLFA
ncbi:MAG TPA: protein-methionine-sulfoxide reductase catalytic subunit MsrP [Stellaceae bacterium]|nr:protein-methionine-sulfoxide reductase catalytic subunit MsrP [Stellaceae bacterium]